mmetsp:Transcript_35693/g.89154  ORF Transcript_35693/g.89154 Transcript_35693/m.89154 type:complete len:626 (-) Transcript_35693:459-2336(-)
MQNFSLEALSNATNGFSIDARLASADQGSNSVVYRGRLRVRHIAAFHDTEVAIKEVSGDRTPRADQLLTELTALTRVRHNNILEVMGFAWEPGQHPRPPRAFLVFPFMSGGTLTSQLRAAGVVDERPDARWRTRVALGIASALAALHANGILHRDVKSQNILFDADGTPKLGDVGEARQVSEDQTHASTRIIGTLPYLDPEYVDTGQLKEASDVFSLGVVMLELLTGRPAYQIGGTPSVTLWRCFRSGTPVQRIQSAVSCAEDGVGWLRDSGHEVLRASFAEVFAGLATRCTSETGNERPTAATLVVALSLIQSQFDSSTARRRLTDEEVQQQRGRVEGAVDPPTAAALTDALQHLDLETEAPEGNTGGSAETAEVEAVRRECVVCMNAPSAVRFGCGHMVACANCAQILDVRGDSCPVCRHALDAARFVDVPPGEHAGTYQEIETPPHVAPVYDDDACVLRFWRNSCPQLRRMWRGANVSKWRGVTIGAAGVAAAGRVVKIDLYNKHLKGELPAALGQLTALRVLSLNGNHLTGTVPETFGQLTMLQVLNLDCNQLTGALPTALWPLAFRHKLRKLRLNRNHFTGTVPGGFALLDALQVLNLDDNLFTGVVPTARGVATAHLGP